MGIEPDLHGFFEEQVQFRLADGSGVEGSIFIGATELLPLDVLRDDPVAYSTEYGLWLSDIWKPEQEQRRNEILSLYGNKRRYADLLGAMGSQYVVPFVGSGMSVPSGNATWSDFLRQVSEFTDCDPKDLERRLESYQFEEAADLLDSATNPRLLAERVEHELRVDDPGAVGGAVRLLPALFPNLVVTTNLDDVLEHSYAACDRPFADVLFGEKLARFRSLRSSGSSFLLKLHGDCREAGSRVLLSREYDATYAPKSVLRDELTLLYRDKNILFLGCSLGSDRWVRLIEEVARSDPHMPKHYCFLALPDEDGTRIKREDFLTRRGIFPIWYRLPHDESLTALLDGLLAATPAGMR